MSSDLRGLPRLLLAVAVLAAAAMLTAWGLGSAGLWGAGGAPATPAPPGAGEPLPVGRDDELRTDPATQLIFDAAGRCRRARTWSEPAGPARAGLDAEGLAAALPGWQVASFAPGRVQLQPAAGTGCPDARPFTLTIRDGEVVILAGRGRDGPIYERSGIAAGLLAPGDLALLHNGHTVEGLDRAWEYLEGIAEHQVP
ncbi:MAG TPA: hypothetical protein VF282_04860 [Bacillota bacterium]